MSDPRVGGATMVAVPYDQSDPRAALSTAVAPPPGVPRPATYRELRHTEPDETHRLGSRTWWVLGSDGRVTGYSGGEGVSTKLWLLGHERIGFAA